MGPIGAVMLLAVCASFVYNAMSIWSWCRAAWICRKLPNGSGNFIYGGLLKALSFNRLREFRNMNETAVQGSGVFYFQFLWRQMVIVTEPRLMTQLLLDKTLHKPVDPDYARFRKMMGPNQVGDLVASEGDLKDWLWRAVRKGVAPAFAPHALRAVYPKVQQKAAQLADALSTLTKGGEPVDMAYAFMCETMDMLGTAGFGKEYHNVGHLQRGEPAEILDVIMAANAEVCKTMKIPLYDWFVKLPGVHPVGQAKIKQFQGIMSDLMAEVRARGPPGEDDSSIAAQLMRIQDPRTGQPLPDKFLLPQFSVLFWAGYDTSGNAMAWTLFCISQYPQELPKVLGYVRQVRDLCPPPITP